MNGGDRPGDVAVRRFLDLSMAHLPDQLGRNGLSGQDGVIAYDRPYGC